MPRDGDDKAVLFHRHSLRMLDIHASAPFQLLHKAIASLTPSKKPPQPARAEAVFLTAGQVSESARESRPPGNSVCARLRKRCHCE